MFGIADGEVGAAEFAMVSAGDFAAQQVRGELHAVADSQDGDAQVEDAFVAGGGGFVVDAGGAAREDDAARLHGEQLLGGDAGGDEPTEDTQFAQAAGDELGGLAAEVENGDDFVVGKFE